MSTPQLGTTSSRDLGRVLPTGETIGRYTSYLDAQKAVDYLADNKFAVQRVSIIGNDLKAVERVTGRLSYPRVALSSALTGAWFGLFVGLILSLFADSDMVSTVPSSILLGAVFWMLFGVLTYAFQRGKRDFTSTNQVIATSYDVLVDPAVAGEARRLLQQLPMNGQAHHPGSDPAGWNQARPNQPAQNQPAQNQPTQNQQAPERPAAWNDPYPRPDQQSQEPSDAQDRTAGPGTTGPRRGQFPDLPDGRPQYGVRVEDQSQPDAPSQGAAPAEAHGPADAADARPTAGGGDDGRSGSSPAGESR
ncbi:general stress protein [Arthrobacter agilis]|uniref:general stress protein n=1 Tax=Arthrobacter agilis TaxID=37921 RepID=UPI0015C5214F|nr:general stress protein [Arthrobacter agilis]